MKFDRSAGVLMHPTSLPGRYGIGDVGLQAYRFVDFLAECGCSLWQVLPLGPTGYGDSPYQSFSAFAGNPYLISPDLLLREGLVTAEELQSVPAFSDDQVDYGRVIPWKLELLDRAYLRFSQGDFLTLETAFLAFQAQQADWLEDYALFMALKQSHQGVPWHQWEAALRDRHPQALQKARQTLAEEIQNQAFRQFLFFRQWAVLRDYAHQRGLHIIGDMPIFVAYDSADVWVHPELFYLDENARPTVVAGVPPDMFTETGQLWGNPLYRWDVQAENGYAWWLARFRTVLNLVDIIRLDHFRGFAGYWEVPAGATTAEHGHWEPGPGADFFYAVEQSLGDLPILAEDLGEITPDVIALRDQFDFPGMKVLVFAFDSGASNPFLPHHYPENCVVYIGTHDNDTAMGWWQERATAEEKAFAREYLSVDGNDFAWDLIRAGWRSPAVLAIAQMQDLLALENRARMNFPGRPSGNWGWRMAADAISAELIQRLRDLNQQTGRVC